MANWRRVRASVLMLFSEKGYVQARFGEKPEELRHHLDCFTDVRVITVADAGHNLQHDQPEQVAQALEDFLSRDLT